ncbi:hypothetical protein ACTXT7_009424 [Hymenolepis weldensis]
MATLELGFTGQTQFSPFRLLNSGDREAEKQEIIQEINCLISTACIPINDTHANDIPAPSELLDDILIAHQAIEGLECN